MASGRGAVCRLSPSSEDTWGPRDEQRPQSWECTNTPLLCAAESWRSGKAHTNSLRRHNLLRALNEKCIHGDHAPLLRKERKTELLPLKRRFPSPWTAGPCGGGPALYPQASPENHDPLAWTITEVAAVTWAAPEGPEEKVCAAFLQRARPPAGVVKLASVPAAIPDSRC